MLKDAMGLKILLVDDEVHILRLLTRVLVQAGHYVFAVDNGDAAREYLAESAADLDAILLDVVIPPRGGIEVLDDALARRPEMPFVLMSGEAIETSLRQRIAAVNGSFLGKPFRPDDLLRALADVITNNRDEG
ncbi:MAG: response regulator [Myxococcota bacterium]|nr:response regulator [Myxococcota bacterium]